MRTEPVGYFPLEHDWISRFLSKVPYWSSGCWLWRGHKANRYGYCRFGLNGTLAVAHRISWMLYNGPIPGGSRVLHKCDTPNCVNPAHLFLGTQADNMQDAIRKGRFMSLRGESNPRAKLTMAQVEEIRNRSNAGENWRALASEFGVHKNTIWHIKSHREWVEPPRKTASTGEAPEADASGSEPPKREPTESSPSIFDAQAIAAEVAARLAKEAAK